MQADYTNRIQGIIDLALNGGIRSVPLRDPSRFKTPFSNDRHRRQFFAACHRSFEKAQNQMVLLLEELGDEPDDEKKLRIELVIRKIADAIAFQMVQTQTHVMRRLCIHSKAPDIDIAALKKAHEDTNKLNAESRQTFALLADLTTFIHIADVLRVDVRGTPKISFIELKSGRVNEVLLAALGNYKPEPSVLEQIANSTEIKDSHRKQALRMMKQRIRVQQAEEVILNEEGIDPGLGVPIRIGGPTIMNQPYDKVLNGVFDEARETGHGAATVDSCLHIGAGYDIDVLQARKRAFTPLNYVLRMAAQDRPEGFELVQQEVVAAVGSKRDDNFKIIDLFANNLHSIATRPFLFWEIKRPDLIDLISGNIRLLAVFDLQKFFWLARREGVKVQFASRSETEEAKAKIQSVNILTFGHRAITYPYGEITVFFTTGLYGRIINEQMSPLQMIREMLKPDPKEVADLLSWAKSKGGF